MVPQKKTSSRKGPNQQERTNPEFAGTDTDLHPTEKFRLLNTWKKKKHFQRKGSLGRFKEKEKKT